MDLARLAGENMKYRYQKLSLAYQKALLKAMAGHARTLIGLYAALCILSISAIPRFKDFTARW